jgi:hypothetical protein
MISLCPFLPSFGLGHPEFSSPEARRGYYCRPFCLSFSLGQARHPTFGYLTRLQWEQDMHRCTSKVTSNVGFASYFECVRQGFGTTSALTSNTNGF